MTAPLIGPDRLAITDISIVRVERLETRFVPRPWPFADARRAEETGLARADLVAEDGWYCVLAGARIALVKILQAREPAEFLRRRIRAHLARERAPELADIRIVRGPADFDPMMPQFITAFLAYVWSKDAS